MSETHWGIDEYDVANQGLISHHFELVDGQLERVVGAVPLRLAGRARPDGAARRDEAARALGAAGSASRSPARAASTSRSGRSRHSGRSGGLRHPLRPAPNVDTLPPMRTRLSLLVAVLVLAGASLALAAGHPSYSWKKTPTGSHERFRGLSAIDASTAWVSGTHGHRPAHHRQRRELELGRPSGHRHAAVPGHRGVRRHPRRDPVDRYRHRLPGVRHQGRRRELDARLPERRPGRVLRLHDVLRQEARPGDVRSARRRVPHDRHRRRRAELERRDTADMPPALPGEAGFAASGQCLTSIGRARLVAGRRRTSRVYHSDDGGCTGRWRTPIPSSPTAGIFALAFTTRCTASRSAATSWPRRTPRRDRLTNDGGASWQLAASAPEASTAPASSSHAAEPGDRGGADRQRASTNGGNTWTTIGHTASTRSAAGNGACWASGEKGRVLEAVRAASPQLALLGGVAAVQHQRVPVRVSRRMPCDRRRRRKSPWNSTPVVFQRPRRASATSGTRRTTAFGFGANGRPAFSGCHTPSVT